jgi:hypothetical protein
MVEFSERTLECQDFHEAFLQSSGACRPVAGTRHRAGWRPGDPRFAQRGWK